MSEKFGYVMVGRKTLFHVIKSKGIKCVKENSLTRTNRFPVKHLITTTTTKKEKKNTVSNFKLGLNLKKRFFHISNKENSQFVNAR